MALSFFMFFRILFFLLKSYFSKKIPETDYLSLSGENVHETNVLGAV